MHFDLRPCKPTGINYTFLCDCLREVHGGIGKILEQGKIHMKTARLLVPLLGTWMLAAVAAQAEYEYQVIEYPGAASTEIFAINDRGDVAGNGVFADASLPFIYSSKKQTFTNVTPIAGYERTALLGLSDSGMLVGSVGNFNVTDSEGFLMDKQGNVTVFAHPEAVSLTQPRGVNNNGLVAGFRDSAEDRFAQENGFIYDSKTGEFTDIVHSLFTIAQGINNKGDVVGSAVFFEDEAPCPADSPGIVRFAWVRKADGTVNFFQVNGSGTSARGISDSGAVTGFVTTEGGVKGFVVNQEIENCEEFLIAEEDLLVPPGSDRTIAASINNAGLVAGGGRVDGTPFGFVASQRPPKGKKK